MTVENMERFVKIHHNLRIMHRIKDFDYEEVKIVWDVDAVELLSDDEEGGDARESDFADA